MNVFDIRTNVVDHYAEYMKSFVRISDPEIKGYVEDHLSRGRLWPDPMVQLNPSFAPGGSIDELVADGTLHPLWRDIFRYGKDELLQVGIRLNWKEERRAHLQTELDGIYPHLYGPSRVGFEDILGTFPLIERNDIKEHSEFRFADDPTVDAAKPEVGVT